MSDFRRVSDNFCVSPQITESDVAEASTRGFAMVINNRPEGESADQTPGQRVEQACRASGLAYLSIPISHSGFSAPQVAAMTDALRAADGPILAYCRSGTRSTFLWALAQAKLGQDLPKIATDAARAGYDISPIKPLMDIFAAQSLD